MNNAPSKLQPIWQLYFDKNYQAALDKISEKFINESFPEMLHIAGLSMVSGGKPEMGIALLKTACLLMPQVINWYANASVILCEKFPNDALGFASEGLVQNKHDILYFCEGNANVAMQKNEDAVVSYENGLKLNPKSVEILLNLGNTYRKLDQPKKAFECYDKILQIDPTNHRAQFNNASFKMSKGEHIENAKEMCQAYLQKEDSAEVAFMLSLFLLDEGNYIDGWKMYSRRWESNLTAADRVDMRAPLAVDKETIKNKKVIIFHEQGFGDSLQFCRYINMMSSVTNNVTLVVPVPLARLFQKSFPQYPVVNSRAAAGNYDYEVPMLNLPLIFETTVETIPNTLPYLKYEKKVETPCKIGIVWAGHKRPDPDLARVDSRRSCNFQDFLKITNGIPPEMFGSLQLGVPAHEAEGDPIVKLLHPSMDFLDSANIIKNLDLVISVDTSVCHLAAGLGVPTLMISRKDSCWRWSQKLHASQGRPHETEWYPNMKVFYQKEAGNWDDVFEEVNQEIKKRYNI
jgi:tetratricopeptide (TPR) repeat protein